jgi:hypothetical protein
MSKSVEALLAAEDAEELMSRREIFGERKELSN